ncbi:MAG: 2-oxoacid:acceptor oxidoreductase subunit alpha [Deltaproteobacteria bacterium]|nr:2-oxoacid:acceptor oxidoreductase subunit alpha [Deltaproteobacteria bacterium]
MTIDLNILIGGAAGQGVHSISAPLGKALVRHGAHVFTIQDYQSRIRGGHLFNVIRVSDAPLSSPRLGVDILVALNQETLDLHREEVSPEGIVIYDASQVKETPEGIKSLALSPDTVLPDTEAGDIAVNAGACGAILGLVNVPVAGLVSLLEETFGAKGEEVVGWNRQAAQNGHKMGKDKGHPFSLADIAKPAQPRLLIAGHEAMALGALAAGLNFISGYPMTPWTSLFTAVSQRALEWGVVVEQAEDEIAAMGMAVGASFAGARAMTGTSGGGFCLMTETVGLAAMTETPLVCVVAMRPGPSTGLPTRTSQGDLEFVLFAGQDDSPRALLAPGTPAQGYALTVKAFDLAERYQIPVFILTDQFFADSQVTCTAKDFPAVKVESAVVFGPSEGAYERYAITESGVSPRRLPGFGPELVVADSDEHTPDGHLTEDLEVRIAMHDKRLRKLKGLVQELDGVTVAGREDAGLTLLCWGSSFGPVKETLDRLQQENTPVRMVHLSELWPFPKDAVTKALQNAEKIIGVEGNATGQLNRLLRQETGITADRLILKYDGRPFTPEYILRELKGQI